MPLSVYLLKIQWTQRTIFTESTSGGAWVCNYFYHVPKHVIWNLISRGQLRIFTILKVSNLESVEKMSMTRKKWYDLNCEINY